MRRREVLTWRIELGSDGERTLSIQTDHGALIFMAPHEGRLSDTTHFISFDRGVDEYGCFFGVTGIEADQKGMSLIVRLVEMLGPPLALVFASAGDLKIVAGFMQDSLEGDAQAT